MAALQEKLKKVQTARAKLEAKLSNIYSDINNSIDKQDSKIKVERLAVRSKDAFITIFEKNDELFDVALRTEDQDAACKKLEKWLENVTKNSDEIIAAARPCFGPRQGNSGAVFISTFKFKNAHNVLREMKPAST